MTEEQLEQLKHGREMAEIEAIPPGEYYDAWMNILSERQAEMGINPHAKCRGLTLRRMIERMLLGDIPFEADLLALAPEAHRHKIAEVLRWKKEQLKNRAAVFGNLN